MESFIVQCQKLWQARSRRLVSAMALIVSGILVVQTFTLPSRMAFSTQFPSPILPASNDRGSVNKVFSSKSQKVGELSLLSDSQNLLKSIHLPNEPDHDLTVSEMNGEFEKKDSDDDVEFDEDEEPDTEFSDDLGDETILKNVKDSEDGNNEGPFVEQTRILGNELVTNQETMSANSSDNAMLLIPISSSTEDKSGEIETSPGQLEEKELGDDGALELSEGVPTKLNANSSSNSTLRQKKKLVIPILSMSEMNSLLLQNRASRRSMRPRWSSAVDKKILAAKKEIENAPILEKDEELFAPLYRSISKFKRSYELMEKTLKIYIYQEGEKPIFHQPILKSIYASEGWFMKLMESNRNFIVKDPKQAHLFYMPFSSRFLQLQLYVPNSHNRTKLRPHLKNYVDKIAAIYPFWNRTGGADHFLAACHDWALYDTKNTMDHCIRALCVADLSIGFQLGKDVSLPQANVRLSKNPLKDIGGRPWNQRQILAFYAGSLHGGLRSNLLQHWDNKDPDMKIFSPSTFRAVRSKMNYIQHMKSSKFCICPRGYEANSPRVVESIFFDCVPVIIADNYVPPFFEILNWEKFSVIVPEKDVPRLKEILVSIPESEYRKLQMGVKKVQQHFLWRTKPVKYDLFHMVLHSIWFNRVYNIKPR